MASNHHKQLKFAEHLVPLVLSGEKTVTWRLFDEKGLQLGDHLEFVNRASGDVFAEAHITRVRETKLGEITPDDYTSKYGHEPFESKDQLLKTYQSYYSEEVTLETTVKLIDFVLVRDGGSRSIERISHFRCGSCKKWWSVGDAPQEKNDWFCTWCGERQELS